MLAPDSHTSPQEKVGILYFHRSLKEEFVQKSELTNHNWLKFRSLYETLEKKLQQTLNQADLPVIEVTSDQQQGNTFGQRLANAVSSAFAKGLDHVIIVGNDCPQLNPRVLAKAKQDLFEGQTVIGPDHQGGAYLIGISRWQFEKHTFASLPWQKPELLDALRGLFSNTTLLGQFQDLNTRKDLLVFMPKAIGRLKSILLSLLGTSRTAIFLLKEFYPASIFYFHLRPPPEFRPSRYV